jgi:uncharacterized SAM-binding protein YcdF (DUF218 family)
MFFVVSKVLWFFATPSNLLLTLVILGCALLLWGRMRRTGAIVTTISILAIILSGLSPLSNWVLLPLEERFPAHHDDEPAATGIVVLGGSVEADTSFAHDQLVVNDAAERVIIMADLARRHPQAKVVFTGGSGALLNDEPAEAAAVERFLPALGLPRDRVVFETQSRSTFENAVYTRRLFEPLIGERWILVTSAFHMPRAVGCFRNAGFIVVPYPVDFRTRARKDILRPFNSISDGLRRLDVAGKEWAGLIAYFVAGRTSELFPGPP